VEVNAIAMRDHFSGGSEFWWGDQGGCGFYISVLPELFVYTMVYTYWLPYTTESLSKSLLLYTAEPRYNDTNFSAIFLRYTEVSFNQGSRAGIINKEGPP
jgi:hypothetical protein